MPKAAQSFAVSPAPVGMQQEGRERRQQQQPTAAVSALHRSLLAMFGPAAASPSADPDENDAAAGRRSSSSSKGRASPAAPIGTNNPQVTAQPLHSSCAVQALRASRRRSSLNTNGSSPYSPPPHSSSSGAIRRRRSSSTHVGERPPSSEGKKERPRRPLPAYNYFFRDECNKLGHGTYNGAPVVNDGAPPANKRRSLQQPPPIPLEQMGSLIQMRWKNLCKQERVKYEYLASQDSERYEREMEEYRKSQSCDDNKDGVSEMCVGYENRMGSRSMSSSTPPSISRSADNNRLGLADNDNDGEQGKKRKTGLQALLAARRDDLLSDIGTIHALSEARKSSSSRRALQSSSGSCTNSRQNDTQAMQRLYNLHAGPGGSSTMFAPGRIGLDGGGTTTASNASVTPTSLTRSSTLSSRQSSESLAWDEHDQAPKNGEVVTLSDIINFKKDRL